MSAAPHDIDHNGYEAFPERGRGCGRKLLGGLAILVVVGLVGAGGLGRLLAEQLAAFDYRGALGTTLALVVLTYLVDLLSAAVRRSQR